MPITSANILQKVQTYQKYAAAYLQNLCCFVSTANTKFEKFQNLTGNLGSTVGFKLTDRFVASNGLIANFGPYEQRVHTLSVTQSSNVSYSVTDEERIFNVEKSGEQYMQDAGKGAIAELGTKVEIDLAKNLTSSVVNGDINSSSYGQKQVNSGPFRFYKTGITAGKVDPLNSFTQLANMITKFRTIGTVYQGVKSYIPDTIVPNIVGTGLSQFTPKRNDETAMSWDIGTYGSPEVKYYQSNLLPTHTSGTVGNEVTNHTLTVVSTNDPTGANITQITFSGATNNDPDAIKYADLAEFLDSDLRWLTRIGHHPTTEPAQFRVTADAAADGSGNVIVNIVADSEGRGLSAVSGRNQNINKNIVAGMTAQFMPSHRAGGIISDNALFLGMPRLPGQEPFISASEYDATTGVATRMTYGSKLGENQKGIIHDCIWGSSLIPEYCSRILLPV